MSSERGYAANLLGAAAVAVADRLAETAAQASPVGGSGGAALTHLHFYPGQGIDALARVLGISTPGTVQVIDRLVREGLVQRLPAADRRRRKLRLTEQGGEVARRILAVRGRELDRLLASTSATSRDALTEALEAILGVLSGSRAQADSICRLCDEHACPDERCPVEQAVPIESRIRTGELAV